VTSPLRVRLSGSGVASYLIRRGFMASGSNWRGRVAEVTPTVVLESRSLQTLLALAEDGVAIIPSMLKTKRYELRIVRVTHRRKPVQQQYTIQWDRRRPIPC
jgi:DNA-binding transcriptional LysR family regulator